MSDPWEEIDWLALERIRKGYLGETAGRADYWESESDLFSYDQTFAQRIGWKWDHVCQDLLRRGWSPPSGGLLDWGCGSGIAHRSFLRAFPQSAQGGLKVWDRSPLARDYSMKKARRQFEGLSVSDHNPDRPMGGVVLLSHVWTELDETAQGKLLEDLRTASAIIWVEPGTYASSRSLIGIRAILREQFHVVAPCVHQETCGLLKPSREHDWCHHFAEPAREVFTSPQWASFNQRLGIDLRSLAVSYLVLDNRAPQALPNGAVRLLGRPRVYKAHALLLGCDASGVSEGRLMKRHSAELFRKAKKDTLTTLQTWVREEGDILEAQELGGAPESTPASSGT